MAQIDNESQPQSAREAAPGGVLLAVNGGLMRGMPSNHVMLEAGAVFVRDDSTAPEYRMWSIDNRFPAMMRVSDGGAALAVEMWSLDPTGFVAVLEREPRGLSVAKVLLSNGDVTLGVVGEPILCQGREEITAHGGWRTYLRSLGGSGNRE